MGRAIQITCKGCKAAIKLPYDALDSVIRCPNCAMAFRPRLKSAPAGSAAPMGAGAGSGGGAVEQATASGSGPVPPARSARPASPAQAAPSAYSAGAGVAVAGGGTGGGTAVAVAGGGGGGVGAATVGRPSNSRVSHSSSQGLSLTGLGDPVGPGPTSAPLPPAVPQSDGSGIDPGAAPAPITLIDDGNSLLGQMMGQYRLVRMVGRGARGIVYEAEDVVLHRTVAVKVLAPESMDVGDRLAERFLQEARMAGRLLEHPNCVGVINLGRQGDHIFLAMPLIRGGSVRDKLEASGPFTPAEATRVCKLAARGLAAAHAIGIIHRDIKPDNIMLGLEGEVRVADFGIAKHIGSVGRTTEPGRLQGTPYYVSPEQCDGRQLDPRTDIYSLGATYFCLLTGRPPFAGGSLVSVIYKTISEPHPDPRTIRPDIPEACVAVLDRAMAKDPADRFATAQELADALEQAERLLADPFGAQGAVDGYDPAAAQAPGGYEESTVPSAYGLAPVPPGYGASPAPVPGYGAPGYPPANNYAAGYAAGLSARGMSPVRPGAAVPPGYAQGYGMTGRLPPAAPPPPAYGGYPEDADPISVTARLMPTSGKFTTRAMTRTVSTPRFRPDGEGRRGVPAWLIGAVVGLAVLAVGVAVALVIARFSGGRGDRDKASNPAATADQPAPPANAARPDAESSPAELTSRTEPAHNPVVDPSAVSSAVPAQPAATPPFPEPSPATPPTFAPPTFAPPTRPADPGVQPAPAPSPSPLPGQPRRPRHPFEGFASAPLDPEDPAWLGPFTTMVRGLRVNEQAEAVAEQLARLNPGFVPAVRYIPAPGERDVQQLELAGAGLADLTPVKALSKLEQLVVSTRTVGERYPLKDLRPLRKLPLRLLIVAGAAVTDLGPVKGCRLEAVNVSGTGVSDLSPLDPRSIRVLLIADTPVTDLASLRDSSLRELDLSRTKIADLSPLRNCPLEVLVAAECPVSDLSALAGMRFLSHLDLSATKVKSLDAVAAVPTLRELRFNNTAVTDLSPLAGLSRLTMVEFLGCAIPSKAWGVLEKLPIREIRCDLKTAEDVAALRRIATLTTINGKPAEVFYQTLAPLLPPAPVEKTPAEKAPEAKPSEKPAETKPDAGPAAKAPAVGTPASQDVPAKTP